MSQRSHPSDESNSELDSVYERNLDTRFNELHSKVLDHRATSINHWLAVIAIVFGLFGVIVAIGGVIAFERFREIESEATRSLREIRQLLHSYEEKMHILDAEFAQNNPDEATATIAKARENPNSSLLERAASDALSFQNSGQTEKAIEKWRSIAIISETFDNEIASTAWFSVGYLFELKDMVEEAILAYEQAIRIRPSYAHAYKHLGIAKVNLHKYDEAIIDYDKAVSLRPEYYEAYTYRGHAKHYLYQFEEAIADHNEAIRLKSDFARPYTYRGHVKHHMQRYEDAIADYDIAIRLDPSFSEAYSGRGEAKYQLELYEMAITDYDKAIRLEPDYWWALFHRGEANYELERYEEAISDYDEVIRLKPDNVGTYVRRGDTKGMLNRVTEAIADYDIAIKLVPDFAMAYLGRGRVVLSLGLTEKAKEDLEIARKLAIDAKDTTMLEQAEKALSEVK